MNVNFAERAHNHNWKLDPIVRSLLDTDFYKLLMLQFIWKNFPTVHVTSEVVNRTVEVRLAERVSAAALIDQMEHVRGLRFRRSELVWLAGNTFYGVRSIFEPAFLDWLEKDFRLSDYEVLEHDGQLTLRFSGLWSEVTMWEVYCAGDCERVEDAVCAGAVERDWSWMCCMRGRRRGCGTRLSGCAEWRGCRSRTLGRGGGIAFCGRSTACMRCG